MYAGLSTSDTLHKKPCRIGLGLCLNFQELLFFYALGWIRLGEGPGRSSLGPIPETREGS
jgi:hypothetical protein